MNNNSAHTPAFRRFEREDELVRWLRSAAADEGLRLQSDSRRVQPGDVFIGSQPGEDAGENRRYALDALARGAVAAAVDAGVGVDVGVAGDTAGTSVGDRSKTVALIDGLKSRAGAIADALLGHPSRKLRVCAFTGTNGKTSSAWWLSQALAHVPAEYAEDLPEALRHCGIIGTLGVGDTRSLQDSGYTTPEPVLLQSVLHEMLARGCGVCALEASSIGIAEHRLSATQIHTAVFTNFTQDHLDYHGDMQAYWEAKRKLFAWEGLRAAVINRDEDRAGELMELCCSDAVAPDLDVWTYSLGDRSARIYARNILTGGEGMSLDVVEGIHSRHVRVPVVGMHNVSNLLGVIATMRTLGVPFLAAVRACEAVTAVPGRMDAVHGQPGQPLVVVDFAHTPDAVKKALQALRPMCDRRGGQLWCVVGCGGNRDAGKRPLMAAMAEAESDHLVLTSDNPRDEQPQHILDSMIAGLYHPQQAAVIVDRGEAIRHAVGQAAAADVILLAGKGHEAYQEVRGQRLPFSDHLQAEKALVARGGDAIQGSNSNG